MMKGGRPGLALEPLRTLFGAGTAAGLTDAQLLERFAQPSRRRCRGRLRRPGGPARADGAPRLPVAARRSE